MVHFKKSFLSSANLVNMGKVEIETDTNGQFERVGLNPGYKFDELLSGKDKK